MRGWGYITQIPEENRRQFIAECLTEYIEEAEKLELAESYPEVSDAIEFYSEIIRLMKEK